MSATTPLACLSGIFVGEGAVPYVQQVALLREPCQLETSVRVVLIPSSIQSGARRVLTLVILNHIRVPQRMNDIGESHNNYWMDRSKKDIYVAFVSCSVPS